MAKPTQPSPAALAPSRCSPSHRAGEVSASRNRLPSGGRLTTKSKIATLSIALSHHSGTNMMINAARATAADEFSLHASAADETLLGLLTQWPDVRKRNDAAYGEREAATELYFALRPKAPALSSDDRSLFSFAARAEHWDEETIGLVRRLIEVAGPLRDDDLPYAARLKARARDVVANWDLYLGADEAARQASGLAAAERKADAALIAVRGLLKRITATPAASLAGALAKIEAVADHFEYAAADGDENTTDDVLFSAARDIGRLAARSAGAAPSREEDAASGFTLR